MPADYHSAAEALAVSPSRESPSSSSAPPWARRRNSISHSSRLSMPAFRSSSSAKTLLAKTWDAAWALNDKVVRAFLALSPAWRVVAVLAAIFGWVFLILALIYSHAFFEWLAPVAKNWRALPGGWVLVMLLVMATSFPPLMGYSTACTIAGFVYGFPLGWPIVAVACTLGSFGAFLASRTVLSGYVDRWVGQDKRFVALGQVLRKEGILYLTAIRFCPLPFSLSNGFLATIPSVTPIAFALSTALSSPKLLVHVFIGSRLAILAEEGDEMSFGAKFVNYLSMFLGGAVGVAAGLVIYRRTMSRAAELAREEGLDPSAVGGAAEAGLAGPGTTGLYEDQEEGVMMDPEDAAALMSDDDVSLWETNAQDYHDDEDDDEDGDAKKQPVQKNGNGSS